MQTRVYSKKNKRGLALSVRAAQEYCALDFDDNKLAKAQQQYTALQLSEIFAKGADDVDKDESLSYQYCAQGSTGNNSEKDFDLASTINTTLAIFTTFRLLVVRLNRVLFFSLMKSFLSRAFGVLGFSYLLNLGIDLGVCCYRAAKNMHPPTPYEELLPFRKRAIQRYRNFSQHFNNELNADKNRKSRMENDTLWGFTNLFLFYYPPTTLIPIIVNILAFAKDVHTEIIKRLSFLEPYDEILARLHEKITPLRQQAAHCESQLNLLRNAKMTALHKKVDDSCKKAQLTILQTLDNHIHPILEQYNLIQRKIQLLEYQYHKALTARKKLSRDAKQNIIIALIIFIGVVIYATPGLNIAATLCGAILALGASIFCGYNRIVQIACGLGNLLRKIKRPPADSLPPLRKPERLKSAKPDDVLQIASPTVIRSPSSCSTETASTPATSPLSSGFASPSPTPSSEISDCIITKMTRSKSEKVLTKTPEPFDIQAAIDQLEIWIKLFENRNASVGCLLALIDDQILLLRNILNEAFTDEETWLKQVRIFTKQDQGIVSTKETKAEQHKFYFTTFPKSLEMRRDKLKQMLKANSMHAEPLTALTNTGCSYG